MDDNPDVGSSCVQVLDGPMDISEGTDVQFSRQEEEEVTVEIGREPMVHLVGDGLLLMDEQGVLVADGSTEVAELLATGHIYVESGNEHEERSSEHDVRHGNAVEPSVASTSSGAATSSSARSPIEQRNDDRREAEESSSPRFGEAMVVVASYPADEQNGDSNLGGQQDQELQVVPDSSAAVSSERRFLSENLHEAMEVVANAPAVSLEMQMVPTSSNGSSSSSAAEIAASVDETLMHPENDIERDAALPVQTIQDPNEVPISAEDAGDVAHGAEDGRVSTVEGQQAVPVLTVTPPPPAGDVEDTELPIGEPQSVGAVPDEEATPYAVQEEPHSADHTYEVCVTIPGERSGEDAIPFAIGDRIQEIPIELSDWANLEEQSLVAITEDGTTIPLTVIRQGPDGELTYQSEGNDVQLTSEILQQLASSHFLDGSVVDADTCEGRAVEVIEMLQSEDGTVILESADVVASTSSQQIIYSDSTITAGDQSILPDAIEEIANVIHIPENAYLSGQPFEVQFVDVSKANDAVPVSGRQRPPRGKHAAQNSTFRRPSRISRSILTPANRPTTESATSPGASVSATVGMPARDDSPVPVRDDGELDDQVIELSNTTPSVISPENMQALIQILQTLPQTARGQTIQIILQSSPASKLPKKDSQRQPQSCSRPSSPKPIVRIGDKNVGPVVRMFGPKSHGKTTTDIAIQVSPEFIDDAQTVVAIPSGECTCQAPPPPARNGDDAAALPLFDVRLRPAAEMSEDERSKAIVEALVETPRKKRPYRKKNSKQIVTVEEQWVVDPKPGVSYYAVVDYLSEHDQDGFSSASEMKRPEAPSSEFMEDHLELQNVEVDDLVKTRSVLESTINSSVFVSPFRRGRYRTPATSRVPHPNSSIDLPLASDQSSVTLQERTFEEAQLEEGSLAVGPMPQVIHVRKRRTRVKPVVERFDHKCGHCQFDSGDKILVVEHCIREHPEQTVKTLSLQPKTIGRTCPYCRQIFPSYDFFSHMRRDHNDVHPYKCGYCNFMGRDRNQIRHHIQKKHRLPMKVINLLDSTKKHEVRYATGRKRIMALSEGEETVYEYLTDEEELEDDDSDNVSSRRGLICPECKKTFKTLKYLKTHIKVHQAHRYQCGYCDFISIMLHQVLRHCQKKHGNVEPKVLTKELEPEKNPIVSRDIDDIVKKVFSLNTRLPRDPDNSKWMRKWFCPHCDYTCQFGASYRRHLRMHANILPYKCNYCSFKGREKYYVRRHIHRMHTELPVIVVENTPENCARDTSSDEDFQEKGLRRKRRRRTKESIHAVVPVEEIDPDAFQEQYQMQPIREKLRLDRFPTEDLQNVPPVNMGRMHGVLTRLAGAKEAGAKEAEVAVHRLPWSKEQSGENISDYILGKEGDKIVCKVCLQKTPTKAFYKHARKHFKVKPFKCGYCNYMAVDKNRIYVHNSVKHPNLPVRTEECHLLSVAPKDFMDLIVGAPTEPSQQPVSCPVADPQFVCPLCQAQVEYDEKILSEHFYVHFEYYPYQCSECDHQNVSREKIANHATVHDTGFVIFETGQSKPDGLEETIRQFLKEGQELVQHTLHELMDPETVDRSAASEKEETELATNVKSSPLHLFLCPICDSQMNLHSVTVRRHLYGHFDYKPFKCGHCSFHGVSKAKVKRHAATHGGVRPKVEISDGPMPEDLAEMLGEIHGQMKELPAATSDGTSDVVPTSTEGKTWHETLCKGDCPWCGVSVGPSYGNLRSHLLDHFAYKPFACACGETFASLNEASEHMVEKHPNKQLKEKDLDEETVRKGLRSYRTDKKQSKVVDATPQSRQQLDENETKKSDDDETDITGKDVTSDKSTEPENGAGDSNKEADVYEFDDNADIVTVEGVLLTRTFRSEAEASSDEDGRESWSDEEEDFFVGDVSSDFVRDVVNLLNRASLTTSEVESTSGESQDKFTCNECQRQFKSHQGLQTHVMKTHPKPRQELRPLFACGYCEFCSNVEETTLAHMQESHSEKPAAFAKRSAAPRRGPRRRGGGGVGQRRPAPRRRLTRAAPKILDEEDGDEETVENITKMVLSDVVKQSNVDEPTTICEENDDRDTENVTTAVGREEEAEQQLHSLTPLIPSGDDAAASMEALENLEECDENLPKILHILQLRPAKDEGEA